jgi:hypothetical protein
MRATYLYLFLALFVGAGCKKEKTFPDGTPTCVQQRVLASQTVVVQEYTFQGALVYRSKSTTGCSDCATVVLGGDCNIVCTSGGFIGPTNPGVYEDFLANATLVRQIWPL